MNSKTNPSLLGSFLSPLSAFMRAWQRRRHARARIYIVPSRYGIWLAITLLFMVLAGAVYANNLVLIIAFLAVTLGVAAMLETHTRVLKLRVTSVSATSTFADEPVTFRVLLESLSTKDFNGIFIQIENPYSKTQRDSYSEAVSIQGKTSLSVFVRGSSWPRGRHFVTKVRVITSHRMGLFTAWREFKVQAPFKSFPARSAQPVPITQKWSEEGDSAGILGFDFGGHRAYREGDDIRRLDWKLFARRNTQEVKVFTEGGRPREEVHWNDFPAELSLEEKLSRITAWVEGCDKRHMSAVLYAPFCPLGAADSTNILSAVTRVPAETKIIEPLPFLRRVRESKPFRLLVDVTTTPILARSQPTVPRWQLFLLTLYSSICVLMESPRWLWMLSATLTVFWILSRWRKWAIPSLGIKGIAILVCGLFTFFEFHQLLGPEAGTCLLTLFTLMKFFEAESYRDSIHSLVLCLVLIASGALLNPNMTTTIHAVIGVWLCGHFFIKLHEPDLTPGRSLRDSFILLVTALPLTVALFFLFPRLSFQLFEPSMLSQGSKTGFSDGLDPGSVSDLVQSDDLQFRAYLDHPLPQRDLYWRGAVLHDQIGMKWKHGGPHVTIQQHSTQQQIIQQHTVDPKKMGALSARPAPQTLARSSVPSIPYRVILQPTNQTWLFALDHTLNLVTDSTESHLQPFARPDDVFEWPRQVTSQLVYRGQALVSGMSPTLSSLPRGVATLGSSPFRSAPNEDDLIFEDDEDPRWISMIAELKHSAALASGKTAKGQISAFDPTAHAAGFDPTAHAPGVDAHQMARQILIYYRDHGFHYTLEPGVNPHPSVSSFLFDWKRGFCEHYAGVTATLLRALNVPAHVVIGFQGGVWNAASGHYSITSRDAHAWVEAWDGKNWFRVDPVETLTPLRLDVGGAAFFEMVKSGWKGNLDLVAYQDWLRSRSPFQNILAEMQNWGESVSSRWNLFLLTFNYQSQMDALKELGIRTVSRLLLAAGLVLIFVVVLALMALWYRRSPLSRLEIRWNKIQRRLERASGENLSQKGPLEIEVYVSRLPESERASALTFLAEYRAQKYGPVQKYVA